MANVLSFELMNEEGQEDEALMPQLGEMQTTDILALHYKALSEGSRLRLDALNHVALMLSGARYRTCML